ncbi:MAG: glyceraldehyde-3-phosphate dehydrogenase [Gammaproteobacteria bacterium]|nr:glyceraldehyde-3-phosphate dehydrogenase [Gammaproteobacteria bacterium]MBT4493069.1 glyceraldehyde-3-phosphate dehydrogenase [Gammaproteobacteria bacterium]MBT7371244.1 glyceraldehyde-3-phosphate dehydrogenase [Gammaproteobacteria bacterium]
MIPMIGGLYRRNVVIYIHGVPLYNQSVIDLMKAHRFVRQIEQNEMSEFETHPMLEVLCRLDLGPAHIDIGKLTSNYMDDDQGLSVQAYVERECVAILGRHDTVSHEPRDVVVYGFGRIGRLVTRLLVEKAAGGQNLVQRAVVLRPPKNPVEDLNKRASLLRRDSVHGSFNGTIRVDEENHVLICNGNVIRFIYATDPADIDYTQYGIKKALVIDSTGVWRDREGLERHLSSKGVAKVLLTTAGKGDIKNIVSGANSDLLEEEDSIVAAASCTTNAIVPVLKCINDHFGIVRGHMETVHAYTDDQNLHDNTHSKERRGRSAALNMVLTETNATKSIGKLLPELDGKLTGNSIRVPVPNVSMAILNLTIERDTTVEEVNEFLRDVSLNSAMSRQIDYTVSSEVVSTDFIGNRHAGIIDSHATIVQGSQVILYVWYDNEFGYSCQVVRVGQKMAGVRYPIIPAQPVTGESADKEVAPLKVAQ